MKGKRSLQGFFIVLTTLSILWLSGCGGGFAALPKEKISDGDKALREAKESSASLSAPAEMKAAEDKLAAAETAFNKKDYDEATRLAEQATVDADFARAKGSAEKARKKAEDTQQNIKTLRQDIEALSKKITLEGEK